MTSGHEHWFDYLKSHVKQHWKLLTIQNAFLRPGFDCQNLILNYKKNNYKIVFVNNHHNSQCTKCAHLKSYTFKKRSYLNLWFGSERMITVVGKVW